MPPHAGRLLSQTLLTSWPHHREPPSRCVTMLSRGAELVSLFPAMIKIEDRKCVVVGAGRIAAAKVNTLLKHGANVVVVSPKAARGVQNLARRSRLYWRRRNFAARDVAGALLVVAATDSSLVNESVFRACRDRGILCNVVDDPEHCDFFYPAVVRRGPLQLAISTDGRSPALAGQLRRELERLFGPEWGAWVEHVGSLRRKLLRQTTPSEGRREELLQISSPQAFREFLHKHPSAKSVLSRHSRKAPAAKKRKR